MGMFNTTERSFHMPGFTTHYIFGRDVYHKLTDISLKKNLYRNRAVYGFGLQGPDFFFYFLPSYILHGHNPGSVAHTTDTRKFYRALIESSQKFKLPGNRRIAEAYLIGFLGHYTLDTICHPFVYGRTRYPGYQAADYFSRHAYLETDIDTTLLARRMHRLPSRFYSARTIALTFRQKRIITTMLYYAYKHTYPQFYMNWLIMFFAVYSLQVGLRLLRDRTGQKKVLYRLAEKYFLGYPLFSPLIPSDNLRFRSDPLNLQHKTWKNPWNHSLKSEESFVDLYDRAKKVYVRRMKKLLAYLRCEENSFKRCELLDLFFKDYENNSFHSGLDCSIPS